MTDEKREEMLGDLVAMDARFEMIGSYPELVAEAKLWDGDESKFADPVAMYLERVEAMQEESLQEEQGRKAAEEATGMFNWSSSLTGGSPAQNIDASMSGVYPKGSIICINGREVDLSRCYATDVTGNKLNKDDFITTPAGNINWYEFPDDEHTRQIMKKKGVKIFPVRLRVGVQQKASGAGGYGFMHVMKHYNQMVDMNPSESPLMHLFNTLTGKLSITKNGILRKTMDSANNGQARKLVIELKEDEGFYSIVSSYPVSYYPRESNGIAIKGVYLKFMPGRAASGLNESNQADSTTPESTGVTGQSLTGRIPKNAKSVNIYDLKILEKDGALVFQQKQEEKVNIASYSVTGGNLAAVHTLSAEKFLAAAESYTAEVGGRGARIAKAFHQVEAQASVVVDVPGVYVDSVSEAKNAIKDAYDELKKNPVTMSDGSVVRFYAPGLNEVKQHAGDRRVFAAIAKMRELSEKAVYIDTAPNTQKDIPSKKTIERYHYYLSKGNFPGYDKWAALRGKNAGASGDAYVMIVVAEEENGDKFYDLDATDVEDVEANKGVAETLETTRFPKAGPQGSSTPKGRIHRVKEYVNHIDAQHGNFSASLTGGRKMSAEMQQIKAAAEKNGTFMKAPNGEPSNLKEWQWLQVRTKAFKDWFGDWENDPENASKVVDGNGEPKVVYRYSAYISKPHRRRGKSQNIHLVTGWITKKAVDREDLTRLQPQATSASRFHRTAIVTPMERYIKDNYAERKELLYAQKINRWLF